MQAITKQSINTIEVSRGIAALLVVIYHISRHYRSNFGEFPFGNFTEIGHIGVDFFFVLSGFIIFYVHKKDLNEPQMLMPYVKKRVTRIFPLFWIVFFSTLALVPFVESQTFPNTANIIWQFFLLPSGMGGLVVGVSWTLQFELLFYVCFGILILNKKIGILVLSLWCSAILWVQFIQDNTVVSPFLRFIFSAYVYQFILGALAAYLTTKIQPTRQSLFVFSGTIIILLMYILERFYGVDGHEGLSKIIYGVGFACLIIGLVLYERIFVFKPWRVFLVMGKSSYSIYLTHLLISGIYFKIFIYLGITNLPHATSALLLIMLTLVTGIYISKYLELPASYKLRMLLTRQ